MKLRELRGELHIMGFSIRRGKGSHEIWTRSEAPQQRMVLYGKNGADAKRYQEARLRKFRRGMMVYR